MDLFFTYLSHVTAVFYTSFSQACLPIIDDLSRSAMRPRHWKQLVRVTGGAVQISNEGLTRMTLGQLLELGLHSEWLNNSQESFLENIVITLLLLIIWT